MIVYARYQLASCITLFYRSWYRIYNVPTRYHAARTKHTVGGPIFVVNKVAVGLRLRRLQAEDIAALG